MPLFTRKATQMSIFSCMFIHHVCRVCTANHTINKITSASLKIPINKQPVYVVTYISLVRSLNDQGERKMSIETRRRVVCLHENGYKLREIQEHHLEKEDIVSVSKKSLRLMLKKYKTEGIIADRVRLPAVPAKLQDADLLMIDEALADDDELSTQELHSMLLEAGTNVSISTVQRAKKNLGDLMHSVRVATCMTAELQLSRDNYIVAGYSQNSPCVHSRRFFIRPGEAL